MRTPHLVLILAYAIATTNTFANNIKGIIIRTCDTLNVTFHMPVYTDPDYYELQTGVKYTDSKGNKEKILPTQAKEIQFDYSGEKIRMLSRIDNQNLKADTSKKIFLRLIIDGKIKLFDYYLTNNYTNYNQQMARPKDAPLNFRYVLQKDNGELVRYDKMKFKTDFPIYVKECKDLVNKINAKEYGHDDLKVMVKFYNTNCN